VPVYNEVATVAEILRRVAKAPTLGLDREIVVVDDGSSDGTPELLRTLAAEGSFRLILKNPNQGKGAALRRGFAAATGDVVLVQDADLEYDPADYPVLLQPILENRADVVYGSRFRGKSRRVHFFWPHLANRLPTGLSNLINNLSPTDMETGYKVFRREVLEGIALRSNRFGFEPVITAKIARQRQPRWR